MVLALPKRLYGDFNNQPMIIQQSATDLFGWGDNTTGVLANGQAAATNAQIGRLLFDPNTTLPPSNATIVDWAFTNASLYVVYSNGWVYSAGKNDFGQLGHGNLTALTALKRIEFFVLNSKTITKVWAFGSAALTSGGGCVYFQDSTFAMYGCGHNTGGNLGNAATPTSNISTPALCAGIPITPNRVTDVYAALSSSKFSAYMVFNDGALKVAGGNPRGQLGTGNLVDVSGAFVNATKTGGSAITNVVSVSPNGSEGNVGGNAILLDSGGLVWATGDNTNGELGQGNTVDQNRFTQIAALSGITKAELGGGRFAYGYALNAAGTLFTWGRNTNNNLFRNNTTTPVTTPSAAPASPGAVSKVFMPKGGGFASADGQMLVLTTAGKLAYAGTDLGQLGVANAVAPGAYKFLPTPRSIADGSETIADLFVHGTSATQRWFILTNLGNLYSCGNNLDSVCTGGMSSDVLPASVAWQKVNIFE